MALAATVLAAISIAVEIEPTAGVAPWRASALEHALAETAADHPGVEAGAPGSADLDVAGVLGPAGLAITVRDREAVRARSHIAVNGAGLEAVRRQLNDAITPLLHADVEPPPPAPDPGQRPGPVFLLIAGALLLAPVVAAIAIRGRGAVRLRGPPVCIAAAAAIGAAVLAPLAGWQVGLAGGAAWAGLAIAVGRLIAPPLPGFSAVEHANVFRLIRVQLSVTARRAIAFLAVAGPPAALVAIALNSAGVDRRFGLVLLAPLCGLGALAGLAAIAELAAERCDRQVIGEAPAWHRAARSFLAGTSRRLGVHLELPGDLRFLPIAGDRIEVWGGGLAPGRVGVGIELLELGLAPVGRPHDYSEPREDRLHWSEWHAGLVVPGTGRERGVLLAKLSALERRKSGALDADFDEAEITALGQPRTLAGFVEPSALDERLDFRPAEDPDWLDWDPGDDEDEGVDPNDRDFLAAALARGIIDLRRGLGPWRSIAGWLGRGRAQAILGSPGRLWLRGPERRASDASVALHQLGHPLVQHLSRELLDRDEALTAQASAPELERRTTEIAAEIAGAEVPGALAPVRERLFWLTSLWSPIEQGRRARWARRAVLAAFAIGTLAAASVGVIRAIEYHPRYLEAIERSQESGDDRAD